MFKNLYLHFTSCIRNAFEWGGGGGDATYPLQEVDAEEKGGSLIHGGHLRATYSTVVNKIQFLGTCHVYSSDVHTISYTLVIHLRNKADSSTVSAINILIRSRARGTGGTPTVNMSCKKR